MLIDIRANEIAQLRDNARQLEDILSDMEHIARTNDRILLGLHKLSLLLIAKPANWQKDAVALLTKQFALPHCALVVFTPKQAALAKTAGRLPLGGRGDDEPLPGTKAVGGMKRYFHLPLRKGKRTCGLLIFASKKADAFPNEDARDFMRRLAELIAAGTRLVVLTDDSVVTGSQEVNFDSTIDGFEVQIQGRVTDWWSLFAGYRTCQYRISSRAQLSLAP